MFPMWRMSVGVVMTIIAIRSVQSQTEHIQCTLHSSNLPVAVHSAAVGISNASQSAFLMGGLSTGSTIGGEYSNTVYEWDTDSSPSPTLFIDIATPAPTPFTTRGVHISASIGDVTYVVSPGTDLSNPPDSAIYPFNTATKQWLTPIPFTTPSGNELTVPCVTHNETHLILVDGVMASRSNSPIYILLYEISSGEWTTQSVDAPFAGATETGWRQTMCAYAHGHLYVFGGRTGSGTSSNYMDGVYKYDIDTQTWTTLAALPTTHVYGTALYDGERYIYLVGGRVDYTEYLDDIRIFDTSTDQLSDHTMTAATAVSNAASIILGKELWIFGGKISDADIVDIVQKCNISSIFPTPTPTTTSPTSATPTTASPTTTAPSTPSPTTGTPTTPAPTTTRNPTTTDPTTVGPSSDVHAPTRQPSFVPTELPSFNPTHSPTSKQPSHHDQPSSYPNLSSTPLQSQRNDTKYTISIEADGLTSTQVLLVVTAAFNLSSTPLIIVSTTTDDDVDGTSYVVLVATLPSDFQLETDVIESTVREAIVKEYGDEVEVHIRVNKGGSAQERNEKAQQFSDGLLVALCVLFVLVVCLILYFWKCTGSGPRNGRVKLYQIGKALKRRRINELQPGAGAAVAGIELATDFVGDASEAQQSSDRNVSANPLAVACDVSEADQEIGATPDGVTAGAITEEVVDLADDEFVVEADEDSERIVCDDNTTTKQ